MSNNEPDLAQTVAHMYWVCGVLLLEPADFIDAPLLLVESARRQHATLRKQLDAQYHGILDLALAGIIYLVQENTVEVRQTEQDAQVYKNCVN